MDMVNLNSICRPRQWKTLSTSELVESGYPVYGANGQIGFYTTYTHEHPTVMITCRGATCGNVHISEPKSYINGNAMALDDLDSSRLDLKYLYHYLAKRGFKDVISGSAQPQITGQGLSKVTIPLPPLEEQKRIAAILDKADAIRRKRQQAIKLADEFLRAVFLDMFGDPVENTKGWEVKQLKDLSTKIHSGNTPSGGSAVYVEKGITFFRSQNVWKNNLVFEDIAYIDYKTHSGMSKSSLKNRDILMTKTGRINTENSSLGRAGLYEGEDDAANINGHVYLIRLADKSLCEFILFILTTKEYRDYIRSVCVGGIDKRQLNKEHLEQFPIILPPVDLINKFLSIYRAINLKKKLSTQALEDSIELFNGLNQKAFIGKL